jgi:hypothetical protein
MQLRQRFITLKKKVLNYWQWSNTGGLMSPIGWKLALFVGYMHCYLL